MNYRCKVCVLALGITVAATSLAQTSSEAQRGETSMRDAVSTMSPQEFVTKAGMDGMTEVQLGQWAAKQALSNDVKSFAQQMTTDHSKTNAELTTLAQRKGLSAPAVLDPEHENLVKMLRSKSGAAFDTAYANEMVGAHDKAIALFTSAGRSNDADIAAFAKKALPTLQMHKQMAQKLAAKSGGQ